MDVIQSYFTDSELNNDTLRQQRAILCFIESRNGVPINALELEELSGLLRTIIDNLEKRYATEQDPAQQEFDPFLQKYAQTVFDLPSLTDEYISRDDNDEPSVLVGPLVDMLYMLIGKGIYFVGLEDQSEVVHAKDVYHYISTLFYVIFPRILLQTKNTPEDIQLLAYKGIVDSTATIAASCELYNPEETLQTVYQLGPQTTLQRVNKATLIQFIPDAVLKGMSKLLRNLNVQSFEHLTQYKRQYSLTPRLVTDIQAAVLHFIDILMGSECEVDLQPIIDQVTDFIACPVTSKNLKLALSIMQACRLQDLSFDLKKVSRLLVNQIFSTGGLYVDSLETAEVQLALLNTIYIFTRYQPPFLLMICEDSDIVMRNDNPYLQNCNRNRKENMTTMKIINGRIIDDYDEKKQFKKTNHGENDGQELEQGMSSLRATHDCSGGQLTAQDIPKPRNANFVRDYLIKLFQIYGTGGYHSSRDMFKVLRQVRAIAGKAKQNVLEGHSVNYVELNKTRIKLMNEKLVEYKKMRKVQDEEDERELEEIRQEGMSMQALNKRVAKQQEIEQRNKTQKKVLMGRVQRDLRFSNSVECERDETGAFLTTIGLASRVRGTVLPTGTSYRGLQTTGYLAKSDVERPVPALEATGAPAYDPEKQTPHENLYVAYALLILKNLLDAGSPSRQFQLVLQFDRPFVCGLLSFINTLPDATLQVVLSGIISGRAEFMDNIIVEYLDQLIQGFNPSGAVFISQLFQVYGQRLQFDFIEKLATQVSNGLVVLACQQNDLIITGQCLSALAFIACTYAEHARSSVFPLLLPYIQESLVAKIIKSLENKNAPQDLYIVTVLVYGLFGLPLTGESSQICYDCGIFKALLKHVTEKFRTFSNSEIVKITPSDVVLLRALTDILNNAGDNLVGYTRQQREFQRAVCNIYRQYRRAQQQSCCDERGVVLCGVETAGALYTVHQSDIYECAGYDVHRAVSPAARRQLTGGSDRRPVLSPTRGRANIGELQSQVRLRQFDKMQLGRAEETAHGAAAPQAYMAMAQEARYLLKLDLANTVLGFFRALYPALADVACEIRTMSREEFNPQATGRAGKRPSSRPASGMTPRIGLRLPACLPQLNVTNQEINKGNNHVAIGLDPEDLLIVLELIGANAKGALREFDRADHKALVEDDSIFIGAATVKLERRLEDLHNTGARLADDLRKVQTVGEAKFYNWQAVMQQ